MVQNRIDTIDKCGKFGPVFAKGIFLKTHGSPNVMTLLINSLKQKPMGFSKKDFKSSCLFLYQLLNYRYSWYMSLPLATPKIILLEGKIGANH